MKNKILSKLGISTCALIMAISSSSVMANANNNKSIEPTTSISENNKPQLRNTYLRVDTDMGGNSNSYKEYWDQTPGYEWSRVYIRNDSNVRIYFSVDGYINDYVEPYEEYGFKIHPVSSGRHYINLEGANGADIKGWFGVRESDLKDF